MVFPLPFCLGLSKCKALEFHICFRIEFFQFIINPTRNGRYVTVVLYVDIKQLLMGELNHSYNIMDLYTTEQNGTKKIFKISLYTLCTIMTHNYFLAQLGTKFVIIHDRWASR